MSKDYEQRDGLCWYKMEAIRRLYPEYNDVGEKKLGNGALSWATLYVKNFQVK
jgi:hypothetical protein